MIEKPRKQMDLLWFCYPEEMVPADHLLRKIEAVVDLSWVEEATAHLYHAELGRPGWHPEVILRLFLVRHLLNIPSYRALMRQAQSDLAIRWFIGCPPSEKVPDHSSISRTLERWGLELFLTLFQRALQQCVEAGLVDGSVLHFDGTLMRADVSWQSLFREVVEGKPEPEPEPEGGKPGKRQPGRPAKKKLGKKKSKTDPDCSMATSRKDQPLQPCYKHHLATDDQAGVVVAVVTTTGETSEGTVFEELLEQAEANTGVVPDAATADTGYASAKNYGLLEAQGTKGVIPLPRERRSKKLPKSRFKVSRRKQRAKCPAGRAMKARQAKDGTVIYRGQGCRECGLNQRCLPDSATARTITVGPNDEAWVRAQRKYRLGWDDEYRELYNRHRTVAEGVNGQLKEQHQLRRARWRGLWKAKVQAYLAATVVNLKTLAEAKWEEQQAAKQAANRDLQSVRRPLRAPDGRQRARRRIRPVVVSRRRRRERSAGSAGLAA